MSSKTRLKLVYTQLPKPVRIGVERTVLVWLRSAFRHAPAPARQLLWEKFFGHLWWLEGPSLVRTRWGDIFEVDAADPQLPRYLAWFGIWEPNLTEWLMRTLKPGEVFVDVGANIGWFSVLASRLVGASGHVLALEPMPETSAFLRRNVARNSLGNVEILEIAAWDEETTLRLYTNQAAQSGTTTASSDWARSWGLQREVDVAASPLTVLIPEALRRRVRVVKIDVEGAELHVLRGLEGVLHETREDLEIVTEVTPELLGGAESVIRLLGEYGFQPYVIPNDYSPTAYLDRQHSAPRRLLEIPPEARQLDLIFSRRDVHHL